MSNNPQIDNNALLLQLRTLSKSMSELVGLMQGEQGGGTGGGLDGTRQVDRTTGNGTGGEKALKAFVDQLNKTNTEYSRSIAAGIRTVSDVNKHFSMSINERVAHVEALEKMESEGASIAQVTAESIKRLGYAVDLRTTNSKKVLKEEMENHAALSKAMKKTEMANHLQERGIKSFVQTYVKENKAFQIAVLATKEAYEVSTVALENGAEVTAKSALNAAALGMQWSELMKVTTDYKQNMKAAGMSTDEFNDMMKESSHAMIQHTGNLKKGALGAAENFRLFRMVGADAEGGFTKFNAGMNDAFVGLKHMTGATMEEFNKLNTALLGNTDIQKNMYKMSRKNQGVYMQEMAQRRNALVQGGLLEEQANAVVAAMEGMSGKTAKDRLKDAAKLQASLGAMGMGAEGQEAADILRKGSRATDGEKTRLDEIMKAANFAAAERGGGSIQSEMVQDFLNGMNPMMGPDSPMAQAVTQIGNAVDKDGADTSNPAWLEKFMGEIVRWGNIMTGLSGNRLGNIISLAIGAGFAMVLRKGIIAKALTAGFTLLKGSAAVAQGTAAGAGAVGGKVLKGGSKLITGLVSSLRLLIPLLLPLLAPLAAFALPVIAVTAAFAGAYFATKKLLEIFPGVGEAIGDFIWDSVQWVKEVWPKAKAWVMELPDKFVTGIKELWPAVKNFVMVELPAKIGGAFSGIANFFSSYFKGFGSLLKAGFVYLKDKALGIFGDNDADEKWEAAKAQFAEGPPKDMWGAATEGITDIVLPVAQSAAQLEIAAADLAKAAEERKLAAAANDQLAKETATAFKEMIALGKAQLKEFTDQRAEAKERRNDEKEEAAALTTAIKSTPMKVM